MTLPTAWNDGKAIFPQHHSSKLPALPEGECTVSGHIELELDPNSLFMWLARHGAYITFEEMEGDVFGVEGGECLIPYTIDFAKVCSEEWMAFLSKAAQDGYSYLLSQDPAHPEERGGVEIWWRGLDCY